MKIKIQNTRKNKMYLIIGRLTSLLIVWSLLVNISLKVLSYIMNNCITTL